MSDENEAEMYPLDVTKLTKGQTITAAECERMCGVPATHPRYSIELMRMREEIMRTSSQLGRPLSIRSHGCALIVNTDAEASMYHAKLAKDGERSIIRNLHHLTRTVEIARLTDAERADHDRRLRVWGMKAARLKSVPAALPMPDSNNTKP